MSQQPSAFDCFCIVDLFGHQKIAGRVTEQTVGGQGFIRVDVPAVGNTPAFTRFYGPGAIYSITPVSEEIATAAANRLEERPVTVYIPALPAPKQERDPDEYRDYYEPEDDDEDEDRETTCETCGGVTGPGYSTCSCEKDKEEQIPF